MLLSNINEDSCPLTGNVFPAPPMSGPQHLPPAKAGLPRESAVPFLSHLHRTEQ